jgi:hypothetical protein
MKNRPYFIVFLVLFFTLSLQLSYAERVEPTTDYYQVPKSHVAICYTADLGKKIWAGSRGFETEIFGQGVYDKALDVLKREGYLTLLMEENSLNLREPGKRIGVELSSS